MGGKGSGRWAKGSTGNVSGTLSNHLKQEGVYFEWVIYPPECFDNPDEMTNCCWAWLSVLHRMMVPIAFSPVHDRDYHDFEDFAERPQPLFDLYNRMRDLSISDDISCLDYDGVYYRFDNTEENREYILSLYNGFLEHGLRFRLPSERPWLPLIIKKPHIHCVAKARAKCSVNSFVKSFYEDAGIESCWDLLGVNPLRDVRAVRNEMSFTRYLAHLDCKGAVNKVQYDVNGISKINGYPLEKLLAGEDSDAKLFDEVIKICLMHGFRTERALLEYIRVLGDKDKRDLWFAFVKKNLKLFSAYLSNVEVDNNSLPVGVMSDNISSGNTN